MKKKELEESFRELAKQFIMLWMGESPSISRKELDKLIKDAGFKYGLSEDTYFELD